MSSCSRQYASRHISGLKKACEPTSFASVCSPRIARQRPLLFLYPSWFRQCWHRQYHTDREPGPDQPQSLRSRATKAARHSNQHKQSTTSLVGKIPARQRDPLKPSLVRQARSPDPRKAYYKKVVVNSELIFSALSAELDNIEPAPPGKVVFTISRTQARKLVGHQGPENWIHHEDTGCIIKITPGPEREESTVGLEGSDRACELAKKHVLADTVEDADIEAWRLEMMTSDRSTDILDLPIPPRWSRQTFSTCVRALVNRIRHFGKDGSAADMHHNARIAASLVDLFNDPETRPFSSSSSFEAALKYCKEHTELAQYADKIRDAARSLKIPLTVGAYNEQLKRCIITKNDRDLDKTIRMMRENHIKPDNGTWAIVLQYTKTSESRFDTLERCLQSGKIVLSEPHEALISALINGEMITYLELGHGVKPFMEDMDRFFGESWLTTRALVRMLRVCRIEQARTREASEILGEVAKRRLMAQIVDGACLVELVRLAKKAGNLADALDVVLSNLSHAEPILYQNVLEALFKLAWLQRSLNLCRLLWHFACTWGKVSFRMKDIVWHSMQGNAGGQSLDPEIDNWQMLAGKLIVSQPRDESRIREALPHLFDDDTTTSILAKMIEHTTGRARHEQLQLLQLLIERDLQGWRFYHPIPPVGMRSILRDFHQIDVELRTSGIWRKTPDETTTDQLLTNLPRINLKPRDEALQYRDKDGEIKDRQVFHFNDILLDYRTLEITTDALRSVQTENDAIDHEASVDDEPQALQQWFASIHEDEHLVDDGTYTRKPSTYDEPQVSTAEEFQSLFPLPDLLEDCDKPESRNQSSEDSTLSPSPSPFQPFNEDTVRNTGFHRNSNARNGSTHNAQSQISKREDSASDEPEDSKLTASVSS